MNTCEGYIAILSEDGDGFGAQGACAACDLCADCCACDDDCLTCDHAGIGLPGCPTCDPRTLSEGGPRAEEERDERARDAMNALFMPFCAECLGARDLASCDTCTDYADGGIMFLCPPCLAAHGCDDSTSTPIAPGFRWADEDEPAPISASTTLRELAARAPTSGAWTMTIRIDGEPVTFGVERGARAMELGGAMTAAKGRRAEMIPRPPTVHELKAWPEPFAAVWDGRKRFEIRKADRDFRARDVLRLREWDPRAQAFTGRMVLSPVTYLAPPGAWGLPADMCVMGLGRRGWSTQDWQQIDSDRLDALERARQERAAKAAGEGR